MTNGYQPEPHDKPMGNPPKGGSGLAKLTDSLVKDNEDILYLQRAVARELDVANYTIQKLCDVSQEDKERMDKLEGAILDILDMLGAYANDGNAGPGQPVLPQRDLHMRNKCYKLQRKLTGDK